MTTTTIISPTSQSINQYVQKYNLDQKYPFTISQITFLLQLRHYLYNSNTSVSNSSNSNSASFSTIISIAASADCQYNNHHSIINTNALQWIDAHLLSPYYSKSFLEDLIQSAILHSHVFVNQTKTISTTKPSHLEDPHEDNNDDDDSDDDHDLQLNNGVHDNIGNYDFNNEVAINLFLEAMSGLSGRKGGGPAFEMKVLYEYILNLRHSHHQQQQEEVEVEVGGQQKYQQQQVQQRSDQLETDEDEDNSNGHNFIHTMQSKTFDMEDVVDVQEMIGLLYRLALSCHVLQHWTIDSNNVNDNDDESNDQEREGGEDETEADTGGDSNVRAKKCNSSSNLNFDHIASLGTIPPKNMVESLGSYKGASSTSSCDLTSSWVDLAIASEVNYETFRNWVEINFPQLASLLSSFIHLVLFCGEDGAEHFNSIVDDDPMTMDHNLFQYAQGKRKLFQFPQLQQLIKAQSFAHNTISHQIIATPPASSILFDTQTYNYDFNDKGVTGHFAFGMACMDSNLCGEWYRLYSTESDGFAFLNMQRALTGYVGPTVTIVRPTRANVVIDGKDASPGLFGFYSANPWRESKTFYGTSDCFLFRADPIWNVYRPRCFVQGWKVDHNVEDSTLLSPLQKMKMKENYMYFNPSAGHVNGPGSMGGYGQKKSAKPLGVALGGTIDQPRFFISETFEQCIASSGNMMDMTFESGPLLPGQWDKYYNIDVLEIWGVGGEDVVRNATAVKEKHEDMTDAARRKVQRVDRKQFLEDFRSGLHVGNKLFEHRMDGNVRHDFGVDTDDHDICT